MRNPAKKAFSSLLVLALLAGTPGLPCYEALAAVAESGGAKAPKLPPLPKAVFLLEGKVAAPAAPSAPGLESLRTSAQGARDLQAEMPSLPAAAAKERADFASGAQPAAESDAAVPSADGPPLWQVEHPRALVPALKLLVRRDRGLKNWLAPYGRDARAGLRKTYARAPAPVRRLVDKLGDMLLGDKTLRGLTYNGTLALSVALMLGDAALNLFLARRLGPLLDGGHAALLANTLIIVGAFIAYALVERGHSAIGGRLGCWTIRNYRSLGFRRLVRQEMEFHRQHPSSELSNRVLNDTNMLLLKNVDVPMTIPHYALAFGVGAGLMIATNAPLGLLAVSAAPFIGIPAARWAARMVKLSFQMTQQQAQLSAAGQEQLQQVRTIKGFAAVESESARYRKKTAELLAAEEKQLRLGVKYAFFAKTIGDTLSKYLILVLCAWILATSHSLTIGRITQLLFYSYLVNYGIRGLADWYLLYESNKGGSATMRELMRREPAIQDAPGASRLEGFQGRVSFSKVRFSYGRDASQAPIIDGLDFEAEPGQVIAFVGSSGSGKSTVTRLLRRLWEADSGSIKIDGRELKGLERESYLRQVAMVQQNTRLFNTTIRDNIAYGSENASETALAEAIRMAKADFVYDRGRFPEGLDTKVAEGGGRLSGGERQRIAIARAFLRKAPLLILDEATSALDAQSERDVQGALENLLTHRENWRPTIIVIAHRLATTRHADRIYVLEKGRAVESGRYDELLAKKGRYYELWQEDQKGALAAEHPVEPAAEEETAAVASIAVAAAPTAEAKPRPSLRGRLRVLRQKLRLLRGQAWNLVAGDKAIAPYLKPYRRLMAGVVLLGLLEAWTMTQGAGVLQGLLDAARSGASPHSLILPTVYVAALAAATAVAEPLALLWQGLIKARSSKSLRDALNEKLLRFEVAFHMKRGSGELSSQEVNDVSELAEKNTTVRLPLLGKALLLAFSLVRMWHTDHWLTIIVLLSIPVLAGFNSWFGDLHDRINVTASKLRRQLGELFKERFEQIEAIKTSAQEEREIRRVDESATAFAEIAARRATLTANTHTFASALTDFSTKYLPYLIGAWTLGTARGLTIGQITAMTFFAGFVKIACDELSSAWLSYRRLKGSSSVIRRWYIRRPRIADRPGARTLADVQGLVRFENVSFRYGDAPAASLDGVTFEAAPGETVAFVGASGSGKSTALAVLQRFYEAQSGRVTIDGHDVRDMTLDSLNRQLPIVSQDTLLFNDTIRYNMVFGSTDVSEEDLAAAIKAARADFVYDKDAFPKGLATIVGEGGSTLSGGQMQRIAIVRALLALRRANILLLDEATAALDAENQREVQDALDHIGEARGKKPTTFVIAHRLTTIINADKIVVFDKGRIVEIGSPKDLLARGGAFARLWAIEQGGVGKK